MTDPKPPKPKPEEDYNPGLDFKFDPEKIDVLGKERTVEMQRSGLYLFAKDEKFETKAPTGPTGVWVSVPKTGIRAGSLIETPPTRTVKFKGLKTILELTKKTKP